MSSALEIEVPDHSVIGIGIKCKKDEWVCQRFLEFPKPES